MSGPAPLKDDDGLVELRPNFRPLKWSYSDDPTYLIPKEWVVQGLLVAGEVTILSAPSFFGKSTIVTRLAVDVMAGRPFFGHEVAQGGVLYIAGERDIEVRRRIIAASDGDVRIPILSPRTVGRQIDLRDPRMVDDLLDTIADIEAQSGDKVRLVIVDTVPRLMPGADENSSTDAGTVADALARLADTGAAVVGLWHPPKDGRGVRGSNAIVGAADRVLDIMKKGDIRELRVVDANTGPAGTSVRFTLRPVLFDIDPETGKRNTVVVAMTVEDDAPAVPGGAVAARAAEVLRVLEGAGGYLTRQILLDVMRKTGVVTPASAGEQVRRALIGLQEQGRLAFTETEVRLK